MMNDNFFNAASTQVNSLDKLLERADWKTVNDIESGYIFTDDFLATNWNNVEVQPNVLPKGNVEKGMRKISSPILLLKSHSSKMAFICATESSPVYVASPLRRDKANGFTMLFSLKPHIHPEYFFYMSKYDSWTKVSRRIDELEKCGLDDGGFLRVGDFSDGYVNIFIYAEDVFKNGIREQDVVPSLTVQEQRIEDAKVMEKVVFDKMSERERKFQQKEWLNEAHIRNCKHRLSNDVMPIHMAVDRLEKFIATSADGVKMSSIVGKATQETVENLLNGLADSIRKIEEDIDVLTKVESEGRQSEILEVEQFVRDYCEKIVARYNSRFSVCVDVKDKNLKIKISRLSLMELFENIFSNAVRHGFTDGNREDYKIHVIISETNEGNCKIDIANNGNPISERGRKEYFVRGSFAGETGHTGLGGARVFEICEEAKGKAMEPYSTADFTVVSVEFPIASF